MSAVEEQTALYGPRRVPHSIRGTVFDQRAGRKIEDGDKGDSVADRGSAMGKAEQRGRESS